MTMKNKIIKRQKVKSQSIESLPQDLIVEIVAQLVQISPTPLNDLNNLKITCKSFHAASKARRVGRCVPIDKEWSLHWWNKKRYLTVLRNCADAKNPQACFILGLEHAYNLKKVDSGLQYLDSAMQGGHEAATYAMGIILFGDEKTRSRGMKLLDRVAEGFSFDAAQQPESTKSGSILIERCRGEVVSVLRRMTTKGWYVMQSNPYTDEAGENVMKDWVHKNFYCSNVMCGRVLEDWVKRGFCSSLCRWTFEYLEFYKNL